MSKWRQFVVDDLDMRTYLVVVDISETYGEFDIMLKKWVYENHKY